MPTEARKTKAKLAAEPPPVAAVGGHFPGIGNSDNDVAVYPTMPAALRRPGAFPALESAKLLGVSIATFRQWEGEGAIMSKHDPITGNRIYVAADLRKIWIFRQELQSGSRA